MYQNNGQLGLPGRAYAGFGLGVEELCVSDLRVGSLAFGIQSIQNRGSWPQMFGISLVWLHLLARSLEFTIILDTGRHWTRRTASVQSAACCKKRVSGNL